MERDRELDELGRLLDGTLRGTGGLAIVTGPVACGKTALLRDLGERTVAAGATFLGATGSRVEQALPLGLVSQLLYSTGGTADCSGGLQPTVDGMLADLHDRPGPGPGRLADRGALGGERNGEEGIGIAPATLYRLCKVFFDLATNGPLVIGVDDAHHTDLTSLLVLLYLARRLRTVPILLVLTQSSRPPLSHALLQTEFLQLPGCTSIRLGPLSPRGVETLMAGRLGPATGAALAAECHRISGGSPLLVQAIADDHQAAPVPDGVVLGDSFDRALGTFLFRAEHAMCEVARALAVLGADVGPVVLAEVLALGPEATANALDALTAVGLLRDGWFRYEGVRSAVLRAMPSDRPAALHARAAEALHNAGAPVERIARHLVAAERPAAPWAADVLRRAAEEVLRVDDVTLAVKCLRVALELCREPQERAKVRVALMRIEWRVDPAAAARHLPELCVAARESRLDCRGLSALVSQLMWHGRLEESAEVLETIARHLAELGLTPDRNKLTVCLMISEAYPELSDRLLPAGMRPDPVASEVGSGIQVRAAGSLASVLSGYIGHDTVETAEAVLEGSRLDDDTLSAIIVALVVLILADQCERAAFWCGQLVAESASHNAPMWTALLTSLQALTHLRRGELPAAEQRAREALALVPVESWGAAVGLPVAVGLLATTVTRPAEAAAFLAVPVPDVVFRTPCGLLYLLARGRHHLANNRVQAALSDFLCCGELMEKFGLDAPNLVAWRIEAAAAYLRLGRKEEARQLLDAQLAATSRNDQRTHGRVLALLAATTADLGERARLLAKALDHLQAGGDRYEQMVAATELSRTYARLGADASARAEEDCVHRLAELCGLGAGAGAGPGAGGREVGVRGAPLVIRSAPPAAAGPLLGQLAEQRAGGRTPRAAGRRPSLVGPMPRGPQPLLVSELSRAELRVVALAARGHTNRQIAHKLFITVSTVEQHLTRAYRKLRVDRRADLPAHLLPDETG
ncbi:AAA family ATPase [Kitasatospora sp. NPDC048296]|uniref:helix-turn-helix transcriptional regulator n=1 Tax=Kitasatospora sp. NPDC048296 TaxID=3364048 RepID=UPI003714C151